MSDDILVPAIIDCEITNARLSPRPTPAQEMASIAKAILAVRYSRDEARRLAYREVLQKELRRKSGVGA